MHATRTAILGLAAGCLAMCLVGCLFPTAPPSRTNNQGGGSLLSATGKIAAGQMSQLTPDEVQILTDTISDTNPQVNLTLSDDEAQAITDFLEANDLDTPQDFADLDPESVEIPQSVEQIFENLDQFGGND